MLSLRRLALAGALTSFAALLIAYFYMQRYLLLPPCPLCILDRFAVGAFGLGCLFLAAVNRGGALSWALWLWNALALAAGFVFAGRHIWLQNRPPEEAALCLTDNAAAAGLVELVGRAFDAKADCGAIVWEFAGMSIPEQVLLLFVFLLLVQALLAWRIRAR